MYTYIYIYIYIYIYRERERERDRDRDRDRERETVPALAAWLAQKAPGQLRRCAPLARDNQ